MTLFDQIHPRLNKPKGPDAKGNYMAWCPFHPDGQGKPPHQRNLSVHRERGFICHACGAKGSLKKLAKHLGVSGDRKMIVAVYDYKDEERKLLFQSVRQEPKKFFQRRPDGKGGLIKNLKGVRRVIYQFPDLIAAMRSTPAGKRRAYIAEGEKDVLNLWKLDCPATTNPMGAGKWRKEYTLQLKAAGVEEVIVLADNDPPGEAHARAVATSCIHSGLKAKIIRLPGLPEKGDVSDWLGQGHSFADLDQLIEKTPVITDVAELSPTEVEKEPAEDPDVEIDPATIAHWIIEEQKQSFARDDGGKLYVFEEGVYRPSGDRRIRVFVKRYFLTYEKQAKWNSHKAQEVINYIEADAPGLWETPPLHRINVLNGIVDIAKLLETGNTADIVVLDHSPEHLSPIQIPVRYDPAARCPRWERQVEETFPKDAQDLAWEIVGWLMTPMTSIQRAILFLGEGGTGKSTFLTAVKAFLGRRNIAAKTLHRIEGNRFSVGGLFGKLANICADLPTQDLTSTAMFKALTGGDEITGEHKFLNEFSFTPFARLIFSANRPPKSNDPSEAFFERWVVIPFDKKFRGQTGEISRHKLDAALADPGELSGALNKALAALPKVLERGFTVSESMRVAHQAFRETTDPVLVWIQGNVIEHPEALISKEDLLAAYNRGAAMKGRPIETAKAFSQALKRWKPELREVQRTWKTKHQTWCWLGIGLRSDPSPEGRGRQGRPKEDSRDSQDSRGNSQLSKTAQADHVSHGDTGASRDSQDSRGYPQLSNRATPPVDRQNPAEPRADLGASPEERTREKGVNVVNPVNQQPLPGAHQKRFEGVI